MGGARIAVASIALLGAGCQTIAPEPKTADVLIVGGTVFDGTGSAGNTRDIAVSDDRIVFIGEDAASIYDAETVIDASGLMVSPGFIDPHLHPVMAAVLLPMQFITALEWDLPWGSTAATVTTIRITVRMSLLFDPELRMTARAGLADHHEQAIGGHCIQGLGIEWPGHAAPHHPAAHHSRAGHAAAHHALRHAAV